MIDPAPPPGGDADHAAPVAPAPGVGTVPWSVGEAFLTLFIWLAALYLLGRYILAALAATAPNIAPNAFTLLVTQFLLLASVLLYVRFRHPGEVGALFGPTKPDVRTILFGLGAGAISLVVFNILLGSLVTFIAEALRTELPPVQEEFRELAGQQNAAPLLVFGAVFIGPIAEEVFYRGMLFGALRRRFRLWPAMLLSGGLFGLSHLQTTLKGYLLVLIIIIPLGMFLAWIYERRGSLVVPVLAHVVFNVVQVTFLIRSGGQL